MKKLFFATIALVASVAMVSCQKNAETTASIVGTWESTKTEISAKDKNGVAVPLEDVIYDALKNTIGLIPGTTDEDLKAQAKEAAAAMSSSTSEVARMTFEADGTLKASVKDEDGKWEEAEVGKYKLDGDKLTLIEKEDGKEITVTSTVLLLNATELKIQMDAKDMMSSVNADGVSASEVVEMMEQFFGGYDLVMVQSFKRI